MQKFQLAGLKFTQTANLTPKTFQEQKLQR